MPEKSNFGMMFFWDFNVTFTSILMKFYIFVKISKFLIFTKQSFLGDITFFG